MFRDRRDAGVQLAHLLMGRAGSTPVIVGLPRGGVPVAAEVAPRLQAPLDIIVVRKIGCPWRPELGVGALAEGGVQVVNVPLARDLGISRSELEDVIARERAELARRVRRYRCDRAALPVAGRCVIVVDDGVATGYTARAAIRALRRRGASRVILAVPVASEEGAATLRRYADAVVAVSTPRFLAIAECYEDFSQTSDDDVVKLLDRQVAIAGAVAGGR